MVMTPLDSTSVMRRLPLRSVQHPRNSGVGAGVGSTGVIGAGVGGVGVVGAGVSCPWVNGAGVEGGPSVPNV